MWLIVCKASSLFLTNMWQSINIGGNDYIIKNIELNGSHSVLLSDFINIWGEELRSVEISKRSKHFNPLVEAEEDSLVKWTLAQLNEKSGALLTVKECDDAQILEINSRLAGLPFKFRFYLKIMMANKFYEEMTLPLLLMHHQLQAQKNSLIDLIKKKDKEIAEYKMEGARLVRKNIETTAFEDSLFEEMCSTIPIPSGALGHPVSLFTLDVQDLYTHVVKKYKDATKTESDVNSSDSSPEKKQRLDNGKSEEPLPKTENSLTQMESAAKKEHKVTVKDENDEETQRKQLEQKLIAKQRKEALKKKRLPL